MPYRSNDVSAHKWCSAAHFIQIETRAFPILVKIAHTFKATVSHPVFNNSYFGHVVAPPRPVDVYILCVVSSIVHIAKGIEADDHFKTKVRQPIGNVSLQKGQSSFDTGRLIAVRASSQQDSWHVVAQRVPRDRLGDPRGRVRLVARDETVADDEPPPAPRRAERAAVARAAVAAAAGWVAEEAAAPAAPRPPTLA